MVKNEKEIYFRRKNKTNEVGNQKPKM